MKKQLLLTLPICALGLSFNAAHASDYDHNSWYIGGTFGVTNNNTDSSNQFFNTDQCTIPGISCSADDKDSATSLFGGYQINKHFSVELGYVDLGTTADLHAQNTGATITVDTKQETTAFTLMAKGKHPLGHSRVSAFGKAGLSHWKSKATYDGTPDNAAFPDVTTKKSGTDPVIGVGLDSISMPTGHGIAITP